MNWKNIFARKDLEGLLAEAAGEHRLHRVLGPWSLTALGVGCIIGAGIFVVTGRAAALDAGPGVILSYAIAGVGCALAALCYAEFAAMAPVAGSAYTYAYTTLGEIFAWIIGWDLILEYAMGCATVASAWTSYLNKLLGGSEPPSGSRGFIPRPFQRRISQSSLGPDHGRDHDRPRARHPRKCADQRHARGRQAGRGRLRDFCRLGLRESRRIGRAFPSRSAASPKRKKSFPTRSRSIWRITRSNPRITLPNSRKKSWPLTASIARSGRWSKSNRPTATSPRPKEELAVLSLGVASHLAQTEADQKAVAEILPMVRQQEQEAEVKSWGILGTLGLNRWLLPIDDATRSPFMPYGLSGIMLGAAIVFFAFIGFDSISTHAEEARRPQRDVPIGILVSLGLCTLLYIVVAAVVTGMVPYPDIDTAAPIAAAFEPQPGTPDTSWLQFSRGLIAAGGLAGMTSVLLVLFLSQARIFMAMSRDGLLPQVFSTVHPRFRTPHVATILTGVVICVTAAFTPILALEEMVNVGTLMAFVMVCAAVWVLRFQRPSAERPFRCPAIWFVAPAGMLINVTMTLFLSVATWIRLVGWLAVGLVIYFTYSLRHSHLAKHLMQEIGMPRKEVTGTQFDPEVVE